MLRNKPQEGAGDLSFDLGICDACSMASVGGRRDHGAGKAAEEWTRLLAGLAAFVHEGLRVE